MSIGRLLITQVVIGVLLTVGLVWLVMIAYPVGNYELHLLAGFGCGVLGFGTAGLLAMRTCRR